MKSGPRQGVWQAPLFLFGVVALVGVLVARPCGKDCQTRQLERDLAQARQLLERTGGDADAAAQLAQHALDHRNLAPARVGEAYLLLGTAQSRQAEKAPPEKAPELWQLARASLEAAEHAGVPDADQGRLNYRIAKVGFYTAEDPRRVADRMADSVKSADNLAEGYNLLTQAYLRLPEPDLQKALWANEQLRREVPLVGEEVLGPARLQGGELLLKLNKPEEARKVLEKVGPQSPPEVLARARYLRARSFQDENRWSEAASLWQALLADSREPPADAGLVLYHLGTCYRRMDQPREAERMWQDCARMHPQAEGPAACLALADLYLNESQPDKAVEMLAQAVKDVAAGGAWKAGSLVEPARALEAFVKANQALRQGQRYELALKLMASYEKIAPPGKAEVLRGDTAAEWGKFLRATPDGVRAYPGEVSPAAKMLRQAGQSYCLASEQTTDATEQMELTWQAANRFLDGDDRDRAVPLFERYLKTNQDTKRQAEGWFLLGEAQRLEAEATALAISAPGGANDPALKEKRERLASAASASYRQCATYATPFAYRARYQLAVEMLERGDLDDAEAELNNIVRYTQGERDPEAKEKTLLALGRLYYHRRNFKMVVRTLEQTLGRFPMTPEGTQARFQLADSYFKLASQEKQNELIGEYATKEVREHFQAEHRRWLTKAAEEFEKLSEVLDKPESAGHLRLDQAVEAPFTAAGCRFDLGQYTEAKLQYEKLAKKYKGQKEGLSALGGLVRCYDALRDPEQTYLQIEQVREVVLGMSTADPTRLRWEQWLNQISRQWLEKMGKSVMALPPSDPVRQLWEPRLAEMSHRLDPK